MRFLKPLQFLISDRGKTIDPREVPHFRHHPRFLHKQRGAIMIPGAGTMTASKADDHVTNVTLGTIDPIYYVPTHPSPPYYLSVAGFGYDTGDDPFGYGTGFGSIVDNTFDDSAMNSRTINALSQYVSNFGDISLFLQLSGTAVPNTDQTFQSIYNQSSGNEYFRSTASYDGGGDPTTWNWDATAASYYNSYPGTETIEIRF